MTSSRLVYKYIPDHKIWKIRASLLGKIFIILDIICFLVQVIGASMLSSPDGLDNGINVFTLGLIVQEIFIVVFTACMITFQLRTSRLQALGVIPQDARIKRVLIGMYVALGCITVSHSPCARVELQRRLSEQSADPRTRSESSSTSPSSRASRTATSSCSTRRCTSSSSTRP
jgi:hypothetical protein